MTKLPATIEQAEALEFARDRIVRLHRRDAAGGSLLEAAESREFVRNAMRLGLGSPLGRMRLVELALAGEADADAILRAAILECQSWHTPMPDELIEYNRKLVAGMVRPAGWSGPRKKTEFMRNVAICVVVAEVVDRFGLKPTGRSARKRSACAVVGQALAVIHMRKSPKAVETIWNTYGHAMPAWRGWSY